MLEPQSEDGLCAWGFFDEDLAKGKDYPVQRLADAVPLTASKVRPLAEDRVFNKHVTFEALYESKERLSFSGSPVSGLVWLDDGEHFLQVKSGRLQKVYALTGRCQPFHDPQAMARGLASLATIDAKTARSMARRTRFQMNEQRTGALFQHEGDLYFARFDGTVAARLTRTAQPEELATFSPDGRFVAFVREGNLLVVDPATQTERALTTDGGGLVTNGKADWVYFEEIFKRNWQAYWWSPDSARLAFLQFDDTAVHEYIVVDQIPLYQQVQRTRYPKAGTRNPSVRLGVVTAAGGPVHWIDTSHCLTDSDLLIRVVWTPDGQSLVFYTQDRAQTRLDVYKVAAGGGEPKRLLRDTTKAWVTDPGAPLFLEDGSFLLSSERSGWRHLYQFEGTGKLRHALTAGEWEARRLHRVDPKTGWVYFSGTRDSHLAENLYRLRLDDKRIERLTASTGSHSCNVSPTGSFFVDSHSSTEAPTTVQLCRGDGTRARTIDTNPVYALEEYKLGKYERSQIKTRDGVLLEASLLLPPDFDPSQRYPVSFMTYGGPHAPSLGDSWHGGRARDQMLAQMGFVIFRCDPRSASGKGAVSAWTAYRQLGVRELDDITDAIAWLNDKPFIDSPRIMMSGHSYGGFLTAYAMTHSKLFAAGIAGAPVTDWHLYDTIYTERYMGTPQDNVVGYRKTSVVGAAKDLHGRLLLLHGAKDDNVHVQNTLRLVDALQQADKSFQLMLYPRARHGIGGKHYNRLLVDFLLETIGKELPQSSAAN